MKLIFFQKPCGKKNEDLNGGYSIMNSWSLRSILCPLISPEKPRWGKQEIRHKLMLTLSQYKLCMRKTHKRKEFNVM